MNKAIDKWKSILRRKLDSLPPEVRLGIVLAAFTMFALSCLYMTATAFMDFGKGGEEMEIKHIEKLDLYNNVYGKGTEKG